MGRRKIEEGREKREEGREKKKEGNEEIGRIAKERGAWAYVEKPYIIEKIKEILGTVF